MSLFLCILGLFAVTIVGAHISGKRQTERLLSVPRHTVASAPHGCAVRIFGTTKEIEGERPLIAPFSGRPCLGYLVQAVWNEGNRKITDTRSQVGRLFLIDHTGVADLRPSQSPQLTGGLQTLDIDFFSYGANVEQYPALRMFNRTKVSQLREYLLLPNQRVVIYAGAVRNSVPSAIDYRSGSRDVLSLVKPGPNDVWRIDMATVVAAPALQSPPPSPQPS